MSKKNLTLTQWKKEIMSRPRTLRVCARCGGQMYKRNDKLHCMKCRIEIEPDY